MKIPFFNKEVKTNKLEKSNNNEDEKYKSEKSNNNEDNKEEAFFRQMNEMRKEDPLIGAKMGSKEIFARLINALKDSRGVHIETLLCILGSLAGYSCQAALRRELIETKGFSEDQVFVIIDCKDGSKYYFGDRINQPLLSDQYSVWSLAAGAVQHLGITKTIDVQEIFKYVSETVGSSTYGIPRIPEGHKPGDLPINFVRSLWPKLLPVVEKFCSEPNEWPIMYGLALQEVITFGKDVIDPLLALTIAMECAIPMAKVDIKPEIT